MEPTKPAVELPRPLTVGLTYLIDAWSEVSDGLRYGDTNARQRFATLEMDSAKWVKNFMPEINTRYLANFPVSDTFPPASASGGAYDISRDRLHVLSDAAGVPFYMTPTEKAKADAEKKVKDDRAARNKAANEQLAKQEQAKIDKTKADEAAKEAAAKAAQAAAQHPATVTPGAPVTHA
jgi:hypothetical protein